MLKAYKYRMDTPGQHQQKMPAAIGVCRHGYNLAQDGRGSVFKKRGAGLSFFDLGCRRIDLKQEVTGIAEINSLSKAGKPNYFSIVS